MSIGVKVVQRPESVEQDVYLSAVVKGLGVTMRHFFQNLFGRKHIVTVKVELRNQDDAVMCKATVDVELPND